MTTVLVSGATGFIGRELTAALAADGHRVVRLKRGSGSGPDEIAWDPGNRRIDTAAVERARPDQVFHLAAEPIDQTWTGEHRRRILDSRVTGTGTLATALAAAAPNAVLVSMSGVGYYGTGHGDELLTEDSPAGSDFLARVCVEWERATEPAAHAGVRVAIARTGVVLGRNGGALARLLLPFSLGVGGRIGNGRQWMSWIARADLVRVLRFLAETPSLAGPVNAVAPHPVQNAEFARTLARVLHRPAVIPVPVLALKLVFGAMAEGTILASQRVAASRLTGAGFDFRYPRLDQALERELRRSDDRAGR